MLLQLQMRFKLYKTIFRLNDLITSSNDTSKSDLASLRTTLIHSIILVVIMLYLLLEKNELVYFSELASITY